MIFHVFVSRRGRPAGSAGVSFSSATSAVGVTPATVTRNEILSPASNDDSIC